MQVFLTLHARQADVADPIQIDLDQKDGTVVVGGIGVALERQFKIRKSIATLPHVKTDFDVDSKSTTGQSASTAPAYQSEPNQDFRQQLQERGGGATDLQQNIDKALEASSTVLAESHALQSLAEKFPPETERQLPDSAKVNLRELRSDYSTVTEFRQVILLSGQAVSPGSERSNARGSPQFWHAPSGQDYGRRGTATPGDSQSTFLYTRPRKA